MQFRFLTLLSVVTLTGHSVATYAASHDPEHLRFFESKIRPVLVDNCYECHSIDSGKSKGGLLLDSLPGLLEGGDSGPALIPNHPDESLLITALSYHDEDYQMPPEEQLPENIVEDFRRWVALGAPDPRGGKTDAEKAENRLLDPANAREHWAYNPLRRQKVPNGEGAEIDRFVTTRLVENGLAPSSPADPYTLLRRLHFDILGLPPTPEEIQVFIKRYASNPEATVTAVVDALLARPQFGERWARHWLDVARYAESNGKETNVPYPYAWRYRDYVIRAFNEDKPYHRFLTEQIAGDLLPYENSAQQAEQMIATGFLALGTKSLNERNARQFHLDLVDEQIDTLTRAVLGTTVACARCHDHKFDPVPTKDYYALAGIFLSSETYFGISSGPGRRQSSQLLRLPDVEGQIITDPDLSTEQIASLRDEMDELEATRRELRIATFKARQNGQAFQPDIRTAIRIQTRFGQIEAQLASVDTSGRAYPLAMGIWEGSRIEDTEVLRRGELDQPGERVARGFPRFVQLREPLQITGNQSGRLELAQWITALDNPLTARVFVNRIWQHLFGQGIVPSADNFGVNGEKPSHPELLDHLAIRFIEDGWSTKALIRQIVLSDTYRQASTFDEESFLKDPENALLWRMSKRRLDAEAIRDAMLATSGRLVTEPLMGSPVTTLRNVNHRILLARGQIDALAENDNRSVYLPIIRDNIPDALDVFDFAEASLVTGSRDVTTVPGQALYLLNHAFVQDCAADLGYRLLEEASDRSQRLLLGHLLCYGRPPTEKETDRALEFYQTFLEKAEEADYPDPQLLGFHSFCQALLASAEFRYLD